MKTYLRPKSLEILSESCYFGGFYNTTLLEKYPTLFIFAKTWWISMKCACMRRFWIFIHMCEFSRLSIASVDGKQHFSEVVFSALVGFSFYESLRNDLTSESYPKTQDMLDSTNSDPDSNHWWQALGVRVRPRSNHFPYNENPTRALNSTSLKYCLPSTDSIDRQ